MYVGVPRIPTTIYRNIIAKICAPGPGQLLTQKNLGSGSDKIPEGSVNRHKASVRLFTAIDVV